MLPPAGASLLLDGTTEDVIDVSGQLHTLLVGDALDFIALVVPKGGSERCVVIHFRHSLCIRIGYTLLDYVLITITMSTFFNLFCNIYVPKYETFIDNSNMDTAQGFWNRVDKLRGSMSLKELAEKLDLNYTTLRNQRSINRYPSRADMVRIAEVLDTSIDSLISDTPNVPNITPEMDYVRRNKRAEWIMHRCMESEKMLAVLYSFVECMERNELISMKD